MTASAPLTPTLERVELGATSVVFERYAGRDAPFLLLHGIPGHRGTWRGVVSALGPGRAALVPDLLGFGDSGDPTDDCHAVAQAEALHDALDALGAHRVHLAGFDFGGPVALSLLRRRPERVLSLTLLATNAFADTPIPLPLRVARIPGLGALAFRTVFGRRGLGMMWRSATADRVAFPKHAFAHYLERERWYTAAVFHASLSDLRGRYADIEATLADVAVPTRIIWGDRDPFFPVSVGRRTAEAIPGASFLVLEGCGHFVPEERPQAVASELLVSAAAGDEACVVKPVSST